MKENPILPSKTTCSIFGFLLNVAATGEHKCWYDFIVECEHLFLRNIYTTTDLKEMNISVTEKHYEIIGRLLELFPAVEAALDLDWSNQFKNFMMEEVDGAYSHLDDLKENIEHVAGPKKRFAKKN